MSSDGKPLWGFRKIFFFHGLFWIVCGVWTQWEVFFPPANPSPNDGLAHWGFAQQEALVVTALLVGAAELWFWRQLRAQRFTPRNWWIGLVLLLPLLLFCGLPGLLALLNWLPKTCKDLFFVRRPS